MIHKVTLRKKWKNPDSGREFKKGATVAVHPSIIKDLEKGGYIETYIRIHNNEEEVKHYRERIEEEE